MNGAPAAPAAFTAAQTAVINRQIQTNLAPIFAAGNQVVVHLNTMDMRLTALEMQLTVQGTKLTDLNTQLADQGTKLTDLNTQLTDHGTRLIKLYVSNSFCKHLIIP